MIIEFESVARRPVTTAAGSLDPAAVAIAAPYGAEGPKIYGTSASLVSVVSSGTVNFTIAEYGRSFTVGARLRASTVPLSAWMEGVVTAYNTNTRVLSLAVDLSSGSGIFNSWNINVAGERGQIGPQGATGPAGPSGGPTGPAGPPGLTGASAGNRYTFNDATSGDPGNGKFLLNNANVTLATALHVSEVDATGFLVDGLLAAMDDGTNSKKSIVKFSNNEGTKGIVGFVTGALTDQGNYDVFPWTPVASWGSPFTDATMFLVFSPVGDKGDTGPQGIQGNTGAQGPQGIIPEPPNDSTIYGRKVTSGTGSWAAVAAVTAGTTPFTPTGNVAATNVQAAIAEVDSEKLAKTGGVMTGAITLPSANPTAATDAAHKGYVDTQTSTIPNKVSKAGDSMSGPLTINATLTVTGTSILQQTLSNTAGDIRSYGWGGNNNAGAIFLNQAANRYLIYDGANYSLNGAPLYASNGRLWGASDGTPVWSTGGTISGALTVNGLLKTNTRLQVAAGGSVELLTSGSPSWVTAVGGDGVWRFGVNNGSGGVGTSHLELHVDSIWWLTTIASVCYKVGGGPWADSSDVRIKTVTGSYDHGLAELLTLNPVTFQYRGNDTMAPPPEGETEPFTNSSHYDAATKGTQFIGLVAQDCEGTLPEIVTKRPGYIGGAQLEDVRTLDTGPLIFTLINAVKTLAARVEALEAAAPLASRRLQQR